MSFSAFGDSNARQRAFARDAALFLTLFALWGCAANASVSKAVAPLGTSAESLPRTFRSSTAARPDTGKEIVLYNFNGYVGDGFEPEGGLIAGPKGELLGTTVAGGKSPSGCGTAFELAPAGRAYSESILYSFQGGNDGCEPVAGLLAQKGGLLYGTTEYGGSQSACAGMGCGTIFELSPSQGAYGESVLYSFTGQADGEFPTDGLIADPKGTLFGTDQGTKEACSGGTCGIVFELSVTKDALDNSHDTKVIFNLLYTFGAFQTDGTNPNGGVIADHTGALYGTTTGGGNFTSECPLGCGTIFKLTPSGSTYNESVLYSFQGGSDGYQPEFGSLLMDKQGAIYGTTGFGGTGPCNTSGAGCGTVFKLTPSGSGTYTESILYNFQGGSGDGSFPLEGLIADKTGALYGTTASGGSGSCSPAGCGTVFKLTRKGKTYSESLLHSFKGGSDGSFPHAPLLEKNGAFYGTTLTGGASNVGTVYKLTQ